MCKLALKTTPRPQQHPRDLSRQRAAAAENGDLECFLLLLDPRLRGDAIQSTASLPVSPNVMRVSQKEYVQSMDHTHKACDDKKENLRIAESPRKTTSPPPL